MDLVIGIIRFVNRVCQYRDFECPLLSQNPKISKGQAFDEHTAVLRRPHPWLLLRDAARWGLPLP